MIPLVARRGRRIAGRPYPTTLAALLAAAESGDWTMPGKNYASTRYSGLDEINVGNVKNLRQAWSFSTGVLRGHRAAPLVGGSTMYVVTPFPNYLHALDLADAGALKWKYDPQAERGAPGVACCDVVIRGAAYADGRIFYNTLDNHTIAVDAETAEDLPQHRAQGGTLHAFALP